MSGVLIRTEIKQHLPELDLVKRGLNNPQAAFAAAGQEIRKDVLQNFRMGGDYPEVWKKSRKPTGKTLIRTAILRNSFNVAAAPWSVTVGTPTKYAAIHQFGGTIVPLQKKTLRFRIFGRWISKKAINIPRRPMLPVRDGQLRPETLARIGRLMVRFLKTGNP